MPNYWSSILEELQKRHPFLDRMRLSGEDGRDHSVPLLAILQFTVAIAAELQKVGAPGNRVAVVFPRAFDMASWIAVGAAVGAAQQEWPHRVDALLGFQPRDNLYLDDRPGLRVDDLIVFRTRADADVIHTQADLYRS